MAGKGKAAGIRAGMTAQGEYGSHDLEMLAKKEGS